MSHSRMINGVLASVGCAIGAGAALADDGVVNIDFNVRGLSEVTHVGDDGAISSPTGDVWNGVFAGEDAKNLVTEFDIATQLELRFDFEDGQVFTDVGINDLQDSGTGAGFQIRGLVPGETYTVAAYVGQSGGFLLQDASGVNGYFFGSPGSNGWSLPGAASVDYFIAEPVEPYEIEPEVWGILFNLDGAITGLQISGDVIPASCEADWNGNGVLNTADFVAYLNDYTAVQNGGSFTFGDPDVAAPFGVLNTADFVAYLNTFAAGCP